MVECGKGRKVVLSDSLKREIQHSKLQPELRRRAAHSTPLKKPSTHTQVETPGKLWRQARTTQARPGTVRHLRLTRIQGVNANLPPLIDSRSESS